MKPDDFITAPQCPGIYYFRNKINGKYYVGQALKLRRRLRQHARRFNSGNFKNSIYLAIKKYGWENFEWSIIETFENTSSDELQKKLDEEEIKYIE